MQLIHQLQTNVLYIGLMCMSRVLCVQGPKHIFPPLPVSRLIRDHHSFVNLKGPQSPVPFTTVPPAAANKANGKVGFSFAPRLCRLPGEGPVARRGQRSAALPARGRGRGTRSREPAGGPPPPSAGQPPPGQHRGKRREIPPRRYYGEKRDSNSSAGRWGLPGRTPRREKGGEGGPTGRERKAGPTPAQRVAGGWGPLGRAGLALPAAPCSAAPGVTSREGRDRSPAPAACQRRRPAPRSRNSAPRLRRAGRCPSPGARLAKGKTATKAFCKKKKNKKFSFFS